jgi:hypothetical protein
MALPTLPSTLETPPIRAETTQGKPVAVTPGITHLSPKPPAPSNGGYQNPGEQSRLQQGLPFTPNNGNPRGAHNTSPYRGEVPGLRRTRFGGGFIGAQPPAGSVLGARGVSFGRGQLTEDQVMRNEELVAQQENRNAMLARAAQQGMMRPNMRPGYPPPPQFDMAQYSQNPTSQVNGYPTPQGPVYRGGQDPRLGRYRPPQMNYGNDGWADQGGYSYNLPNPFGPYPNFGQGPYGYGWGGDG